MDTLSPIVLVSDQFSLDGAGAFYHVTPQQLANPNREPMLVDLIRLHLAANPVSGLGVKELASIVAQITYGNVPLTNSLVPVSTFAPVYSDGFVANGISTLTWHLPKPLYVPPDQQLNMMFQRRNPFPGVWSDSPGTLFYASVAARSVPAGTPAPNRIYVPYACATSCYASTFSATTGETTPFTSKDNEIGNPFDSALRMTMFSGVNLTGDAVPSPVGVLVQATYGSGKMMIRDQTPFNVLFPANRPVMHASGLMKPKDFLKFTLSLNPIVGASTNQNDIKFSTIGMTGYRVVDTPRGGATP